MLHRWLSSAGLEHLLPAFEAQRIRFGDLEDLNDEDLRELGLAIGERKRFRRALGMVSGPLVSGERRPLTLAFFDMIGSSALCEELDGEDMAEVYRAYRERCCEAVNRFGGQVSLLLGDGILAYFGYPAAHENDSERAVRASLDVAAGVPLLETPANRPLGVRCGVATGRVIVTDLFLRRSGDTHSVTGAIGNLASRLQEIAPPNGIVVSPATAARLADAFQLEELEPQRFKGFSEPVRAFRVLGERADRAVPDESEGRVLCPFVGRQSQRDQLAGVWEEARRHGARAALVHGESGIGKSRLTGSFVRTVAEDPSVRVVQLHASALDEHSPLRPFLGYLRRKLALANGATTDEVAGALAALSPSAAAESVAALAAFLSGEVERDDADPAAAIERRGLALGTLAGHFAEAARSGPLVLVIDDAHWLDASSRSLVARIMDGAREQPLLLAITSRLPLGEVLPGIDPALAVEIPLGPLAPAEVRRMVRSAFGDEPVPAEVMAAVEARTDGVPLFIEAVLRPLLHAPMHENWSTLVSQRETPASVPDTLQDALAARLDRAGRAKEVAQAAAVIGRSFDLTAIARVTAQEPERIARHLDALTAAGILRHGKAGERTRYTFSHALLRDAAYDGLLRDRRQELHRAVERTLRDLAPAYCAERPDIVAHHLTEGGLPTEALPHWLAAGRAAAARSALHEARHALERGAAIAASLPPGPEKVSIELEFASLLGPVLFALSGPGSAESRAVYRSAVELAGEATDSAEHFPVLWGWWRLSHDFRVKHERARLLLRLAEQRKDAEMLLQSHHCNWASSFHSAEFDACRGHIEEGIRLYDRADCQHRPWLFGNHDAKVCAHGELAQVLWMQGHPGEAALEEKRALDWAETIDHAGTRAHSLDLALLHRHYRRDVAGTRALAERMIALAEDRGMAEHRARGRIFLGWALSEQGEPEAGLRVFEEGYRGQRAMGTDEDTPVYACMFAEILNRVGHHELALGDLREVRAELEKLGICNWLPEVCRLTGETMLLADPGARDAALGAVSSAMSIAEMQGVTMLAMRAALSRARMAAGEEAVEAASALARLRDHLGPGDHCPDAREVDAFLAGARPRAARNGGRRWR